MSSNNSTFIKITNADIFKELKLIREDLNSMKPKIKISFWASATALSIVVGALIGTIAQ